MEVKRNQYTKQVQRVLVGKSSKHSKVTTVEGALPLLLQCLVQHLLLVAQHLMEVPHLLPVLSGLASKVFLLLRQLVTDVAHFQCCLLLVRLGEEALCERRDAACGPRGGFPDTHPAHLDHQSPLK